MEAMSKDVNITTKNIDTAAQELGKNITPIKSKKNNDGHLSQKTVLK